MYSALREKMVRQFVLEKGIDDARVIGAMRKVPRHLFVEGGLAHQAYSGSSLPIGFGQTISHPTTVAQMTRALELSGDEKVLEVGTGSGYQAAVLAEMGVKVFTIERIPQLAQRAQEILDRLHYYRVAIRIGDGSLGWPEFAPFRRIILTAHSEDIPPPLIRQLDEGGILVMPIGNVQEQALIRVFKKDGRLIRETISTARFVPLIGRK